MTLYIKKESISKNKAGKIVSVKFTLNNGTKITAEPCYEGWQQWGGTKEELQATMPRIEELNPEFAHTY